MTRRLRSFIDSPWPWVIAALLGLVAFAQPAYMSPYVGPEDPLFERVRIVGMVGVIVGTAWAIRRSRENDDGDARWRYRDSAGLRGSALILGGILLGVIATWVYLVAR